MNQSALSETEQLFFCFGPPKSGTTFLQRTLNLHPEISCPSEHQFNVVISDLENLFKNYYSILQLIDNRTGGQGVVRPDESTFSNVVRYSIESLMKDAARNGEKLIGANDNAIRKNLVLFDRIFDHPKMIYIIRNPADMAISAWHHNNRLAREENDSAHNQLMAKYGGFDDWVRQYARWFAEDVNTYRKYSENNNNIMMVRYEDMISDKRDSLCKIFGFLGADDGADIIGSIVNRSDLAAMRKESSNPDFFRSATTDMGTGVISKQLGSDINEIAGEALQYLGYDIKHQ